MRRSSSPPRAGANQAQAAAARLEDVLSARERQVMRLVVSGRTSKEIARALRISPLTVRTHRENLMRKLGLHTTTQLAALAACCA